MLIFYQESLLFFLNFVIQNNFIMIIIKIKQNKMFSSLLYSYFLKMIFKRGSLEY
jgi:hypothetical protein